MGDSGNRACDCVLLDSGSVKWRSKTATTRPRWLRPAEEAEALSSGDDLITEICWRRVLGQACARRGHPRKASRLIREAVEIADSSDDILEQGEARIDVADVLTRIGKLDAARDAARVGLGLLERKGAILPVANARRRLAKLGTELGAGGAETAAPPARLP